jgi:transcription antitermination factor NusB
MRRRTKARELALQFLYQLDLRGEAVIEDLGDFLGLSSKDRQCQEFALRLITGTKDLRPEIDEILTKVARNWDLKRMATIDRNILRMALFEILYCEDIPPKVSINEAIELGKRFSTANSGSFINGILDRVKNEFIQVGPKASENPEASHPTSESAEGPPSGESGKKESSDPDSLPPKVDPGV